MPSYIESTLTTNETVIYTAKISLWSLAHLIAFGLLTLLIFTPLGLLLLAVAAIRYYTTELAFTNRRIVAKFGFISRRTVEIDLQKVESLQVDQGVIGRIFDFGTLVISGAGNPQAPIPGISKPMQFRRAFAEHQHSTT